MIRMMIAAVVIRLRKNCVELLQKCWRNMVECLQSSSRKPCEEKYLSNILVLSYS